MILRSRSRRIFLKVVFLFAIFSVIAFGVLSLFSQKYSPHQVQPVARRVHSQSIQRIEKRGYLDERLVPPMQVLAPGEGYCSGLKVLVAVHTEADGADRRQEWRETYGRLAEKFGYKLLFPVGTLNSMTNPLVRVLEKEHQGHGDLLLLDYIDSYRNLTIKHSSILRYFVANCSHPTVLLKADEDTVWRVQEMNEYVQKVKDDVMPTIHCHSFENWPVHRSKSSKWHVSKDDYTPDRYPTFCGGFFYLTTHSAATMLVNALHDAEFFWIDDVFVTGLLRNDTSVSVRRLNSRMSTAEGEAELKFNQSSQLFVSVSKRKETARLFSVINGQLL